MRRLMIPMHKYSRVRLAHELEKLPPDEPFCNTCECPVTMVFDASCIQAECKDGELTRKIDDIPGKTVYSAWEKITPRQVINVIHKLGLDTPPRV